MDRHIYLDNNATTALDPRVLEAMLPFMAQAPLNPSSAHAFGRQAKSALNWARSTISGVLGCYPDEILFTSGGTEALNLLLRSLHRAQPHGHWVSTDLEHAAVYETLRSLEQAGAPVTFLSPGPWGAAKTEEVEAACRAGTFALALMGVNNETGVRTDVAEMAALARRKDLFFVVDGVAWLGKEPLRLYEGVSAMAFSAHKLHGPKGVGFAYVKRGFPLKALHTGGGQEGGMRGGTEPLAAIVGLAKAVELLASELPQAGLRMALLRDRLEAGIQAALPNVFVNGEGPRVGNVSNLSFDGVEGESLLRLLDRAGLMVSHGSACSSGALEPSRVLTRMGLGRGRAASSARFSLSRLTTEEEIAAAIAMTTAAALRLRSL